MRERKTEKYAKDIVNNFMKTGDIIGFAESCMQEAAWLGRFSGKNRYMFQDAVKRRLECEGVDKELKEWRQSCS
jgi:hypothetical protein